MEHENQCQLAISLYPGIIATRKGMTHPYCVYKEVDVELISNQSLISSEKSSCIPHASVFKTDCYPVLVTTPKTRPPTELNTAEQITTTTSECMIHSAFNDIIILFHMLLLNHVTRQFIITYL